MTGKHKCRFCQCLYANAYQLEKHIHNIHFDNMLQCRVMCKKRFLSKKNLILHEKICRDKSLTCSFCKIKCGSRKALLAHERNFHNGTVWKCKYCDRKYKKRSDLKHHHLVKHGKDAGKHCCQLCGKFFNTAKSLEYHQFTHTGTRPYSCEHCGKGFIYYTGMNRHIRDKSCTSNSAIENTVSAIRGCDCYPRRCRELRALINTSEVLDLDQGSIAKEIHQGLQQHIDTPAVSAQA
ncbi:zinc finger protein [Culex quinquefasciatus]|uniref:Zinc finger protein n=1 Tax=Culex quinquefasciatus TaxID=7176 RepID=B0WNK3_CULQU|nr:zinc finger protein [Culex quinquefasciatus]|eukprot:XP_001850287.1 zinc finger protein [Culex quinquefasciatus]